MRGTCVVLIGAAALAVCGGVSTPRGKTAADPGRLAVEKVTADMVRAFEARDAAAMVAGWTEDAEFVHNGGEPVRGGAAIEKGFAEYFRTLRGRPKLEVRSEAVRFPAAGVAVTEAAVRLTGEAGEPVAAGRHETVLVRDGGRWKVAVVRETDGHHGPDASLDDLAWLIGTWAAAADGRSVAVTYYRDENRAFIRGTFVVLGGTSAVESGTLVTGRDTAAGLIRGRVFQSDGGFGGGVWTRDGNRWSVDVRGVRADGRELTATAMYVPVDADTVTRQAVNQTVGGVPVANTPPVKAMRQKASK